MYPVSDAVKALFAAEQPQTLRITGADRNGTPISITDADVFLGGFNIDRYSCNGEKLEIGTAIASELTLKLNNANGAFDGIVFEGAELFVEIGIADWSQADPEVTYIPCGYFTPDEQPRRLSTVTLKALDRMTRFDAVPPTLTPWTDDLGNVITDDNGEPIYFVAELVFPCTVAQLVDQAAKRCWVPFAQDLSGYPNYNYTITKLPVVSQTITFRNIIQWCAGIMGTNAYIDWTGSLRFAWYENATGYTSVAANRFNSDIGENDIVISGVQYKNTKGVTIVSGTDAYALDITGNYLAADGIAQIMPAIKNRVLNFTYRAFEASAIAAPYLWPMDVITFTDKDGVDHPCVITNVNFGLNGATALAGRGESEQTNKAVQGNPLTVEQATLIEGAVEAAADKVVDSLTQEEIFNLLTNGGEEQGLYLADGKVYLSASYIGTGSLSANYISGGTIDARNVNVTNIDASNINTGTLNANLVRAGIIQSSQNNYCYWNLNTGAFRIQGSSENDYAIYVDPNTNKTIINASNIKTGFLTANVIYGGTLTLGGYNNDNGYFTLKDASNYPIVTMDNTGISVNKGDMTVTGVAPNSTYYTRIKLIGGTLVFYDGDANGENFSEVGQIYSYYGGGIYVKGNMILHGPSSNGAYVGISDHITLHGSIKIWTRGGEYHDGWDEDVDIVTEITASGYKTRKFHFDNGICWWIEPAVTH